MASSIPTQENGLQNVDFGLKILKLKEFQSIISKQEIDASPEGSKIYSVSSEQEGNISLSKSGNQGPEIYQSQISNPLNTNSEEKNKKQFNFLLNKSDDFEDMKFQCNLLKLDDPISPSLFKSKNPLETSTSLDNTTINYGKSCNWQMESKPEAFKSKFPSKTQSSDSNTKAKQVDILSNYKLSLKRSESFNITPVKKAAQNLYAKTPQNKEYETLKSSESFKSLLSNYKLGLKRSESFNITPVKKTDQNLYTKKPPNEEYETIKSRESFKSIKSEGFHSHSFGNNKSHKHDIILAEKEMPKVKKEIKTVKNQIPSIKIDQCEASNNSIFETPGKIRCSESWISGNQYFKNLSEPDDEQNASNKRESIAKILKESPGNVRSKISLYNSKPLSNYSSNSNNTP